MTIERVLILSPHTDDGEFGCGGLAAKLMAKQKELYHAVFSLAQKSLPSGIDPDTTKEEMLEATRTLGIPSDNVIIFNHPVREFPAYRQEILEELILLRRKLSPDIVLLPMVEDVHQDHHTLSKEGIRAFKNSTVLGYELPWNNLEFKANCFISLQEKHLNKKIKAILCYHSQQNRPYSDELFVRSLARVRGIQSGFKYAEAFCVLRLIID